MMESGICPNCGVENDFSNLPAFARINCEECGTVLIIPKIFKNYQLTEIVEEYKFFKKCRGFDLNSDAKVNVLLLNKKFPDFRLCLKFCTEEADFLIKNLPDENVVPIIEHGIEEGTFYAITPDIECFKLSQYDPEVLGEFEVQSVFAAFKMVASILNTLHEKKIVHHNICPENILIDNEGNVKIDNFLTSRVIYKYESGSRADSSVSHYYVSPEKLYKKSEDSKGDIFSTGVLLYYILTGRFPFDGDSKEEILYSRVKTSSNKNSIIKQNFKYREPIPVTELRNEVNFEYSDLINSLLNPSPIKRPTAIKFIKELILLEEQFADQVEDVVKPESNDDIVIKEINNSISNNKFEIYYQPVIALRTNAIVGFEAFIRWPNSPIGHETPDSFIPLAEKSNLINDLGLWILNNACQQLSEWIQTYKKDYYIVINISPQQIKSKNFEEDFKKIISKHKLNPDLIEFEISKTEHSLIPDVTIDKYAEFIKIFNARASLQEIGERYSSFRKQINTTKLKALKIDGDLLDSYQESFDTGSMFKGIVALANFLAVNTVAEKVETEDHISFLKKIGCQFAQGYFFCKPLPADEITEFIRNNEVQ